MLRIRLSRHGAKKDPHYRVVVADKRSPRDGRFVEVVGYYNPALKPKRLKLKLDRIDHWIGQGAQPTQTVTSLLKRWRKELEDTAEEKVTEKKAPAPETKASSPEQGGEKAAEKEADEPTTATEKAVEA